MTKKLYRLEEGKMLGGVCAGLADYLNFDVTVLRIAVAALCLLLLGAPILIVYIICWAVIPIKPAGINTDRDEIV